MICSACQNPLVINDPGDAQDLICPSCGQVQSVPRPAAGFFQLFWNPRQTLDYLRTHPSVGTALGIFLLFGGVQQLIIANQPDIQAKYTEALSKLGTLGLHLQNPFLLGSLTVGI